MEGWISLHRKISENPLWTCEPFSRGQAWVDLILLANHKDGYFYKRGVKIDLLKGQLAWSEVALSDRWSWSRSKVRKFLNDLEKEQQIEQQKNNVTQVITIKNYCFYQEKGQQKDSKRTAEEQQKDTYNNVNNDNNENKSFVVPTVEQIKMYCDERKNNVNPQRFFDFYESKGWLVGKSKMKSWKAAVRTWEKDSTESPKQPKSIEQLTYENVMKQMEANR
jgi:hypothetical protein